MIHDARRTPSPHGVPRPFRVSPHTGIAQLPNNRLSHRSPPWGAPGFAPAAKDISAKARMLPTRVNGQPAVACYGEDASSGRHLPLAIDVLTLEGALIKEITAFMTPEIFPRLGLPLEL